MLEFTACDPQVLQPINTTPDQWNFVDPEDIRRGAVAIEEMRKDHERNFFADEVKASKLAYLMDKYLKQWREKEKFLIPPERILERPPEQWGLTSFEGLNRDQLRREIELVAEHIKAVYGPLDRAIASKLREDSSRLYSFVKDMTVGNTPHPRFDDAENYVYSVYSRLEVAEADEDKREKAVQAEKDAKEQAEREKKGWRGVRKHLGEKTPSTIAELLLTGAKLGFGALILYVIQLIWFHFFHEYLLLPTK